MMKNFPLLRKHSVLNEPSENHENTTFYYSNFKLFHDDTEILFTSYMSFKKNLQAFLGDEWENYAMKTIFNMIDGETIFMQSTDIFGTSLDVWLELRRNINFNSENIAINSPEIIKENQSENTEAKEHVEVEIDAGETTMESEKKVNESVEDVFEEENNKEMLEIKGLGKMTGKNLTEIDHTGTFELFYKRVRGRFEDNHINETYFRAIVHAFYVSAIKVWKTTLSAYSLSPFLGENLSFLAESKKFLYSKIKNVYQTQFKMLRPILVATERIKDYIYKDGSKVSHNPLNLDANEKKNMDNFSSSLQMENYTNFTFPIDVNDKDFDNEEEDLKNSFNRLRISSENENPNGSLLGKRSAHKANATVVINRVNKKFEKLLNQNMIEFAAHYVNNNIRTNNIDWQISRNFVTSIIEVNYNKLVQLEKKFNSNSEDMKNDIRIRFIQPAQEFYNRLMEIWMIIKTRSLNQDVNFTEYLDRVRSNLGSLWSERFITPTHNFFMTLYYEWHTIKQIETDTEEKIVLFMKKVKENMLIIWEENIVKKAEELTNKTITAVAK